MLAGFQATGNYVNSKLNGAWGIAMAAKNYAKVDATFGSALKGYARLLSGLCWTATLSDALDSWAVFERSRAEQKVHFIWFKLIRCQFEFNLENGMAKNLPTATWATARERETVREREWELDQSDLYKL